MKSFAPGDLPGLSATHRNDLLLAARAALAGGRAAMAFYRRHDLTVDDPTGRGPVTEADRASHRTVIELLRAERPDDSVLSEEGEPATRGGGGRLWVVDPLDGTREFIAQNGEFSVMVGLASEGRARLGAVYQPDPDLLFLGVPGEGAWQIGPGADGSVEILHTDPRPTGPLRLVGSRSHPDPRLAAIEAGLGELKRVVSGSVGVKCAMIARGRADLYIHPVPHLREWDTCAPEAVLRGAGGWVGDCLGNPLDYGKPQPVQILGIFAASGEYVRDRAASIVHTIARTLIQSDAIDGGSQ